MSIKAKFYLSTMFLVFAVVFGIMFSLYQVEKQRIREAFVFQQKEDLQKLARVAEQFLYAADETILINYAKTLVLSPRIAYAGYLNPNGTGWRYFHDGRFELIDPQAPIDAKVVTEMAQALRKGGNVLLATSQAVQESMFKESVSVIFWRLVQVGLASMVIAFLLVQLLAQALKAPLMKFMHAANEIAEGKKGVIIPVDGHDAFAQFSKTFNHMSIQLDKLDKARDEFMAHVTHELRSPLTSVIAGIDLMKDHPAFSTDPKLQRFINHLSYGSDRLNSLINNILDLTRIEAGAMSFEIRSVDCGQIIHELVFFFDMIAQEHGLKIRADIPKMIPLVMSDPERLRQIFSNLIYNAVKFTNQGEIVVWMAPQKGEVQMGVKDTGVGIPAHKLSSLFKKFGTISEVRNRLNKSVTSSGLGLSIVQKLVEAQGGRIWVESEMEKGSNFIFTLPASAAPWVSSAPPIFSSELQTNKDSEPEENSSVEMTS